MRGYKFSSVILAC